MSNEEGIGENHDMSKWYDVGRGVDKNAIRDEKGVIIPCLSCGRSKATPFRPACIEYDENKRGYCPARLSLFKENKEDVK